MSICDDIKGILNEYLEYRKKVFFYKSIGYLLAEILYIIIIFVKYLYGNTVNIRNLFLVTLITVLLIILEYIYYKKNIFREFFQCSKTII